MLGDVKVQSMPLKQSQPMKFMIDVDELLGEWRMVIPAKIFVTVT